METKKITYKVSGIFATQKTVSATVSNNTSGLRQFEEAVYKRLGDNVRINHTAKTVYINE